MNRITHILIIQFTQTDYSKTYLTFSHETNLADSIMKLFFAYGKENNLKRSKTDFDIFVKSFYDVLILIYDSQAQNYEAKGKDYICLICDEHF